ncbi:MAG: 3-deoxy-manno-octulosonate cytidylyltransferase (CMP-KDO synthetase) [Planctomycetota bacterium]|jgi:3-deoxy-manno-octulosonate cytidylyltransferase (CMP-KDO synthetase)
MTSDFRIVIPARFASTRLPGKPLREIHGKTLIEWVYLAALKSNARDIVIATDDSRIADRAQRFGANVCITDKNHATGTDRIVEVAASLGWQDEDVVVNLQGDEPLMPASNINQVAHNLIAANFHIATLHKKINEDEATNPDQVKLVVDSFGKALYFSRSIIPFKRNMNKQGYFGHIGLYAYRVGFIKTFSELPSCELETTESLEQLRALWHGYAIHSELVSEVPGPGIDTERDLQTVIGLMQHLSS